MMRSMTHRQWITLLAVLAVGGVLGVAVRAEGPAEPSRLEREMAGVRVALEELVVLARAQSSGDQTRLLMRRLELATARLEPGEAELRRRRDAMEGTASQLEQMDQMRKMWERELLEESADDPNVQEDYRRQIANFEVERERVERDRWQWEQKTLTLEAELEERRALLRALEAEVDRRLGLE